MRIQLQVVLITNKPTSTLRDALNRSKIERFVETRDDRLRKLKDLGTLPLSTSKVTMIFASSLSVLLKKFNAAPEVIADIKRWRMNEPPCTRHRPGALAPDHTLR
jgi:hypothetical protein